LELPDIRTTRPISKWRKQGRFQKEPQQRKGATTRSAIFIGTKRVRPHIGLTNYYGKMKLSGQQKNILIGAGILLGLVALARVGRKKKGEKYSNFIGSPIGKRVAFTITNSSDADITVSLFDSRSGKMNPEGISITPSEADFNRSLANEPKKITAIEVRAIKGNLNGQAQEPVQKVCKDASGSSSSENYYPTVSAYQAQPGITVIQPSDLTLDGECFLNVKIMANTTAVLLVHYDILKNSKTKFSQINVPN